MTESIRSGADCGPALPTAILAIVIVIGLGMLVVGLLTSGGIGASEVGPQQRDTVLADGTAASYVAVTADGKLTAVVEGKVSGSTRLEGGQVLSLAVEGGHTLVGSSNGTIDLLDQNLKRVASATFDGRVVALARYKGGWVAAYGYGQYAKSYEIAVLDDQLMVHQSWAVPATLTALASGADGSLFAGGSSGQVFVISPTGKVVCTGFVNSSVTTLGISKSGTGVLVGDGGGGVSLVGEDCAVSWGSNPTASGIRAVVSQGGFAISGDDVGDISVLSDTGTVEASSRVASSSIRALIPNAKAVLAIPSSGGVMAVDTTALGGILSPLWVAAIALIEVAAAALLVWRIRTRHPRVARLFGRQVRKTWRNRLAYLFVLPALAIIALFFYYPVADAIRVSFTNTNLATGSSQWVGLANYFHVLIDDRYFHRGLLNLVVFLVAALVKTFSVPLLCALLVFWLRNAKHRAVYRVLLVLPVVVPDLVVTLLWKTIYQPEGGLLNATLQAIGLGNLQRVWLGDENTALFAVLFVGFPFMNAFAFLIFYGGLLQIDPFVFEAASLDGVGPLRRLVTIELPLLRPQSGILVFFSVIGAIQGIASVFVLTQGGPNLATYVPALEMYDNIGQGAVAYASTIGVVLALIILVLSTLVRWRPRRSRDSAR